MRHNRFRFIYMLLVGFVLTFVMKELVYTIPQTHPIVYDFLVTIIITSVVWEGNLRIDAWLNTKLPWVTKTKQRLLTQFLLALLYSAISIYLLMMLYNYLVCCPSIHNVSLIKNSFSIGLFVSFLILIFEIATQFFIGWKLSLTEVEKYKTESAQAQLQNLKDQINPHFLFNNLSVLSSLVYQNQDKAVDFISQLSKVYRYILDSKNNELVSLDEELNFLESYIYLLNIRFDESLQINMNINNALRQTLLPPMCLQMLLENAIKHNEVSSTNPLSVHMQTNEDSISVSNQKQTRTDNETSSKTGLKNIQSRYAFLSNRKVIIVDDDQHFSVTLPLISSK